MRISTRFPLAVQTVMIIAAMSGTQKINSDIIAESTGVNAVIIRNIFKSLKQANMILVSPGPGGAKLARNPDSITLWDIFAAVEQLDTESIFKSYEQSSEHSRIGENIYELLKEHLEDGLAALKVELSKTTIKTMGNELCIRMPELPPIPERNN